MEASSISGAVTMQYTIQERTKKHLRLLTLNLVRWLSRMGSLYRQLQQLPIASAGQLKPVEEEANIITHCQGFKR